MERKGNAYVKKAKRRRKVRKVIVLLILASIVGVGVVYKSSIFLVKNITVSGEKDLVEGNVLSTSEGLKGENIFFINSNEVETVLQSLPYVEKVEVNKKYPSTLDFNITQKNAAYYVKHEEEILILSDDLQVLDKVYELTIPNLMELKGIEVESTKAGEVIKAVDERTGKLLTTFWDINHLEKVTKKITSINIENLGDIRVQIGEVECLLGTDEDIIEKMEWVFDATSDSNNVITKGYIDIRTVGSPIINKQ